MNKKDALETLRQYAEGGLKPDDSFQGLDGDIRDVRWAVEAMVKAVYCLLQEGEQP